MSIANKSIFKVQKLLGLLFILVSINGYAQSKDYNTKKGYAVNGYDVVAYFDGKAMEGVEKHQTTHDEVRYKFASAKNLERFILNPEKYLPKYGGYCAYAVAVSAKKVSVNPETFEIRDGELYLFYNSGRNNTLESWLAESPSELKTKADKNWQDIKKK